MRKIICQNHLLMVYLISFCFVVSHSLLPFRCRSDQSSALLQLKREFAIQKPHFGYASNAKNVDTWKASSDCCLWDGVTCNISTGYVTSLDLSNSGLQGPFPSNSSLFSLDQLEELNLAFNNFNSSRILSGFSQLSRLTFLNLSYSKFSENVPSEISLLTNLVSLDLSGNSLFSLSVDMQTLVQSMTNLRELRLDDVKFYTSVSKSLVNLSSLTSLSLSGCELKGEFPKEIFQLPNIQAIILSDNHNLIVRLPQLEFGNSLTLLDLSFTNFPGEIPDSIGSLESLNVLAMRGMILEQLPNSLGHLKSLKVLDLSFGTGIIPSWLGYLTQLTCLNLSHSSLNGNLPVTFKNLSQLTYLDLSYNRLNSDLPVTFENLSQLTYLDLSHNEFSGHFPSILGELTHLTYLGLSFNKFHGELPISLGNNFAKLTILDIGSNRFSGRIPSSIGNLSQLAYLDLSNNLFHGKFPISLANLTQLLSLDLSENQFAGPIPTDILKNSNSMINLNLSSNSFLGVVPSSLFSMPSLKYLFLEHNQFTSLPSIKNITSSLLRHLSLNGNKISGQVPRSISKLSNLRGLLLRSNNLTGSFEFSIVPELRVLDLSNNKLTGTLPKCFASSLTQLNLEGNNFHGSIPEICADECNLERLILSQNRLEGKLPQSLTKCRELRTLDLSENQLQDKFPFFLQALQKLAVLVLRSNKFQGPVWEPGKYSGFVDLRVCDISLNNFVGHLPSDYFRNWIAVTGTAYVQELRDWKSPAAYYQHSTTLEGDFEGKVYQRVYPRNYLTVYKTIDLSNNGLHGEVPESLADISSLILLNLSSNKFSSLIPLSLANLVKLEALDLSQNMLSGRIPQQLASLMFLCNLNLSQNQLTGQIPTHNQFSTFDNSSFARNTGLCGVPLSNECEYLTTPARKEEKSEDSAVWKSVLRGYEYGLGVGVTIGLVGGHIIISKKLNWHVETMAEYIRGHMGKR